MNVGSGLNVTTPVVGLIVYVPSFSTVTDSTSELSVGLINFAGWVAVGVIASSFVVPAKALNTGVPVCSLPWISIEVFGSAVIVFGVTLGI